MKTKAYAIELREQGHTYNEIAVATGYSLDWCKRNLNTVQKNKQEKIVVAEAIRKAQSVDGITTGEIKYLVRGMYPVDGTKEQEEQEKKAIARMRAAINKAPNTLIRPYWMQPENAQMSLNLVLGAVDTISLRMNDVVEDIRKQLDLDRSYDNSLRYAIIKMLQGSSLAQEGLENHCDVLANVAYQLGVRNDDCVQDSDSYTFMHSISTCEEKCAPNYPSENWCSVEEYTSVDVPAWFDDVPVEPA